MWDLTSKTHISCISGFILKIRYYNNWLAKSSNRSGVKCRWRSSFSHSHRQLNDSIQFVRKQLADAWSSLWQPYFDGDLACQPRRVLLVATMPPRVVATLISLPAFSLLPVFSCSELRRATATSPELSVTSLAEPARKKLRQSILYLGVTSFAIAEHRWGGIVKLQASSTSRGVLPCPPATWPEIPGPPFLLILVPIASHWRTDARREPQLHRHRLSTPTYRPQRRQALYSSVELGICTSLGPSWGEEHNRALGFRRDLAVVKFHRGRACLCLWVTVEWVLLTCGVHSSVPHPLCLCFVFGRFSAVFGKYITWVWQIQIEWFQFFYVLQIVYFLIKIWNMPCVYRNIQL